MRKPDLGDRLVAAALGIVFGAIIGLCLAWLLGVYSNTLGPGVIHTSAVSYALGGAALFGLLGLALGPNIGTVIGNAFSAMYEFESADIPAWLALVVLTAVVVAVWWALR